MPYTPPSHHIFIYVLSTLTTLCFTPAVIGLPYQQLPDKYHGRQLCLRRGCLIIAGIVLNILSPITIALYLGVGSLISLCTLLYVLLWLLPKYLTKRLQSYITASVAIKFAKSKSRCKNRSKHRNRSAENFFPIMQDGVLHNQQDMLKFPYISSISELKDDGGDSCPICLRSIYPPNINRSNIIEIPHDVALDKEPCVTTCSHVMHYKCLREWLSLHKTCPICRSMQLMNRCKVFRCRYDTVGTVVRGDINTNTIDSHNGSINSDMALPTISSGVPHMPTVVPGIHTTSEATSGGGYRELSVNVDLHHPQVMFVDDLIPTYV